MPKTITATIAAPPIAAAATTALFRLPSSAPELAGSVILLLEGRGEFGTVENEVASDSVGTVDEEGWCIGWLVLVESVPEMG